MLCYLAVCACEVCLHLCSMHYPHFHLHHRESESIRKDAGGVFLHGKKTIEERSYGAKEDWKQMGGETLIMCAREAGKGPCAQRGGNAQRKCFIYVCQQPYVLTRSRTVRPFAGSSPAQYYTRYTTPNASAGGTSFAVQRDPFSVFFFYRYAFVASTHSVWNRQG